MLTKLIGNSLKMRGLVILLFGLVVVLALFCLQNSRVDAIPDIGENQQIVNGMGVLLKMSKSKSLILSPFCCKGSLVLTVFEEQVLLVFQS